MFATLLGEDGASRRILQEAVDAGLTEEVTTGAVGLAAFLARMLSDAAQTDAVQAWGEFMRRPL